MNFYWLARLYHVEQVCYDIVMMKHLWQTIRLMISICARILYIKLSELQVTDPPKYNLSENLLRAGLESANQDNSDIISTTASALPSVSSSDILPSDLKSDIIQFWNSI